MRHRKELYLLTRSLTVAAAVLVTVLAPACRTTSSTALDPAALTGEFKGETPPVDRTPRQLRRAYRAVLNALRPGLSSAELSERRRPQQDLQAICGRAARPGAESERAALCTVLAECLKGESNAHAHRWLITQLGFIGKDESVPAIARFLGSEDIRTHEAALRALENIPGRAATDSLCRAYGRTENPERGAALLDAIGSRRDPSALPVLLREVDSPSPEVRRAATAALGRVGGPTAADVLRGMAIARGAVEPVLLTAMTDCATRLEAMNDRAGAERLWADLRNPSNPVPIQVAALLGGLRCRPDDTAALLREALKHPSLAVQGAAINAVRETADPAALQSLAGSIDSFTPQGRALLVQAVAETRLPLAQAIAVRAAETDPDDAVQTAALEALAYIGDADTVPLLVQAAAHSPSRTVRQAARNSLCATAAPGVDPKLLLIARTGPPAEAAVCVEALHDRRCAAGVALFLDLCSAEDAALRAAAIDALGAMAAPEHQPLILEELRAAATPGDRDGLAGALTAASRRDPNRETRTGTIVAALPEQNVETQVVLLKSLGQLGGAQACAAVEQALGASDAALVDAAVRALCNWPDATVATRLAGLAENAADPVHRILALRACVRLLGLAEGPAPRDRLALLDRLAAAAERDEERCEIIAGYSRVVCPEALNRLLPLLRNSALVNEAAAAAVHLAGLLSYSDGEQAKRALDAVLDAVAEGPARESALAAAAALEANRDYITAWLIAGPYVDRPKGSTSLLDAQHAPEAAGGPPVRWQIFDGDPDPQKRWFIPLERIIGGNNRAAYAQTWFRSPETMGVRLEVGSDDAVKIWVNDTEVVAHEVARPCRREDDVVTASVRRGWNRILLKVVQYGGHWGACVRVRTPDREHIDGWAAPVSLSFPQELLDDLNKPEVRDSAASALTELAAAVELSAPETARRIRCALRAAPAPSVSQRNSVRQ